LDEATVFADDDELAIVDKSDTSQAASGSTKRARFDNLRDAIAGTPLTAPANPADNGKVAIASGGNLTYATVANANVAADAAIAVSKLAAGSNGHVIKTVDGAPAWAADDAALSLSGFS